MKRYRFLNFFIDTTRSLLKNNDLPSHVLKQERIQIQAVIQLKYGHQDANNKLNRYLEFDPPNITVISEYLDLLHEIADTYVFGGYYPALTGACSLVKRIFNILILKLREYYKDHYLYKTIYGKDSIQDWEKAINLLSEWNIIDSEIKDEKPIEIEQRSRT